MKKNSNNANYTHVILNLFQYLNKGIRKKGQGNKFVKEGTKALGHCGTKDLTCSLALGGRGGKGFIPLIPDNTTCAPLAGTLISKGGKNALDCNQEPSPEFVSDKNRLDCFAFARNDRGRHPEGTRAEDVRREPYPFNASVKNPKDLQTLGSRFFAIAQNDAKDKNIKTLVPQCPSALMPFKKVAFTLAEVLITLGIIGIVAAMTIPTLITNNQKKQTVVKLQRAISVLNQAYKLSYDDVGELSAEETKDFNSLDYFNTYWAPYIKVSTYCRYSRQCGYQSDTPWMQTNNKKSGWYPVEDRIRTTFITADGFLYTIFLATWNSDDSKKAVYRVSVDLNGAEGPNKFGRDVFFLSRTQTDGGGIRPFCYEKSNDEVDKDCSTSGIGECCAEKIRRAGWEIDRDYPWK